MPHDLDLTQLEGGVVFDPADHTELDQIDAGRLPALAAAAGVDLPSFSRRAFAARAFSSGGRLATLIVAAGALDAARRKPFSVNVALLAGAPAGREESPIIVVDRAALIGARERAWTPRL